MADRTGKAPLRIARKASQRVDYAALAGDYVDGATLLQSMCMRTSVVRA